MTPSDTGVVDVSDSARAALADLVSAYAARRTGWEEADWDEVERTFEQTRKSFRFLK